MSRKILIRMVQPDPAGPVFGRVVNPQDFMDWQQFAHEHAETIQSALLLHNAPSPVTYGLAYALPGGLQFSVAAGSVFTPAGKLHDTLPAGDAHVLDLAAADPANPRIDLVYALLETDVDAEVELNPFRRIRSEAENEAGADPYPSTELNAPTQSQTRATIMVRQGVPGAVPAAPVAGAGEVALYQVRVNAGAVNLVVANVTDVRSQSRSLYDALALIDVISAALTPAALNETIDDRVADLIADSTYLTKVYNDIGNLLTFDVDLAALYTPLDARYPLLSTFVEAVQDALANFFPDASPFDWTYDDAGNRVQLDIALATGALKGLMSTAHYLLLAGATNAATASTLVQRDANADASFRRAKATALLVGSGAGALTPPTDGAHLQGDVEMEGKLSLFKNKTTAAFGLTPVLGVWFGVPTATTTVTLLAAANISGSFDSTKGLYRVDFYAVRSVAGSAGTATFSVSYTNAIGATVDGIGGAVDFTLNNSHTQGSFVIQCNNTAPVNFTITFNAPGGAPAVLVVVTLTQLA